MLTRRLITSRKIANAASQKRIAEFDRIQCERTRYNEEAFMEIIVKQRTVIDLFEENAIADPKRDCIIFNDESYSREWMMNTLNQTSHLMHEIGLHQGDHVAYLSPNSPEFLPTLWGCGSAGVTTALLNTSMRGSALRHCMDISDAKALLVDERLEENVRNLKLNIPIISSGSNFGFGTLNQLRQPLSKTRLTCRPGPMDNVALVYTSGTTGLPKAALKKNLQFVAGAIHAASYELVEDAIMQQPLPLFHLSGCLLSSISVAVGGKLILMEKFTAGGALKLLQKYRATHMVYIGEIIRYMNLLPETENDKDNNLQCIVGNGLSGAEGKKFVDRFGKDIHINEVYAASELPNIITSHNDGVRRGSIGRLTPTYQENNGITIVKYDPESEELIRDENGFLIKCEVDEPGIVVMKVTEIFQFNGYYGDEAQTENKKIHSAFEKGDCWVNSGDLIVMNDEYEVFFCDRLGDTFRWKGENISASEVEKVLVSHAAVKECIVYGKGVMNNDGKVGVVAIVPMYPINADTIKSIACHCAENVHPSGVPRIFRIKTSIPMTDTFKYKKAVVAKEDIEEGDYFCDSKQNVAILNEKLLSDWTCGNLNKMM